MSPAYWCVLIAALLPYLGTVTAKVGGRMALRDNQNPRVWLEQLGGWPKRAHWYQLNSFEVFAPFAAAVIIANQMLVSESRIDVLAEAFIAFRLAHYVCYIANWATLRSVMWFGGSICTVWLFLLGA